MNICLIDLPDRQSLLTDVRKMRVLDEADDVPTRMKEGVNLDVVTDFLNRLEQRMPFRFKRHQSPGNVLVAPVDHATAFLS